MSDSHELFRREIIAKDPQLIRRNERQHERWQKDFYQFGREKTASVDTAGLDKIAFLGYN